MNMRDLATTEEACNHPKLASWSDSLSGDHCYQCMGCGKQITIPVLTLVKGMAADEAGIVGIAFGKKWREKMSGGDYERRWA